MSDYTKGPWKLDRRSENLVGEGGKRVGIYGSGLTLCGLPDCESVANSRLIAAAPELLEALRYVLKVRKVRCEHSHLAPDPICAKCKADAAIEKAEASHA